MGLEEQQAENRGRLLWPHSGCLGDNVYSGMESVTLSQDYILPTGLTVWSPIQTRKHFEVEKKHFGLFLTWPHCATQAALRFAMQLSLASNSCSTNLYVLSYLARSWVFMTNQKRGTCNIHKKQMIIWIKTKQRKLHFKRTIKKISELKKLFNL